MAEVTTRPKVLYLLLLLNIEIALCYDNVYDMIERRRALLQPSGRNRYFEATEQYGDRISSSRTRPRQQNSLLAAIRPNDYDRIMDRKMTVFGTGYDNLGNGHFDRSISDNRRFDTFRNDDSFDSFEEQAPFYSGRRYSYERPHRRMYGRLHQTDYPEYFERDYYVRPRTEEKTIDFERKNVGNAYRHSGGQKGLAGASKVDSYELNNEDKKQKKVDSGFKTNQGGTHSDFSNKDNFGESARYGKNGENKSTQQSNRMVKKGHTTKGFASHHHKDETGNTTTFFDESTDMGGQTDYKDTVDEFGTKKVSEQFSGKEDGKFVKESEGQSGNFGTGYLHDNSKHEKDILSNDNHYDKEEKFRDGGELADIDIRRNLHKVKGGYGYGTIDPGMHYERFY